MTGFGKHPFLKDEEISQIIEKLKKKIEKLENNLTALKELAKPVEREKVSADDGGIYESLLHDQIMAATSLSRTKEIILKCNEVLVQLKKCPETYGFDKNTKLPIPVEILLCNQLCEEIPPEYEQRKKL